MDASDPTFPLPDVLRVLDLTRGDATNWSRRGYEGQALPASGKGKARQVSIDDIIRLAIMKLCADLGIPPSRSAGWASIALRLMAAGHVFSTLNIRLYPDEESILIDDSLLADPPRPGEQIKLSINIRELVTTTRTALEAMAASAEPAPKRGRPRAR
jgi:hypothetical protein